MKLINTLILSATLLLIACGEADEGDPQMDTKHKTLIMTPMLNVNTGELMGHIPLPKKWKIEGNAIVGPNGIKTADYPNRNFSFQQRRPLNLHQVVKEDLAPAITQAGGKILGTFIIPELQNYDRAYSNLLWKFGNPVMEFNVLGLDCESPDGNRSLLVIRQLVSQDQYGGNWSYYINAMDANTSVYEEAKNDYIFALSHIQPNMDQITTYNQREIARSNASWSAHQSRMAANQNAFNARNKAWMDNSNAINELNMKGWRSRNAMSDEGQSATINSIYEEQTIYDPASGKSMNVEAGSNRYFTNGNNEYIRTDDYFYEPNRDDGVNMYEWNEWKGN